MMKNTETDTAIKPLTAIKIDPDACRVDVIEVEPHEVATVLRSTLTDTVDFGPANCLVIDDGSPTAAHPSRFHFEDDVQHRPYFGAVLVLGLVHGNWTSTTALVEDIRSRVIWEHWDPAAEHYGEPDRGPV